MKHLALLAAALGLAACAPAPAPNPASHEPEASASAPAPDVHDCPAYAQAMQVTDAFMAAFNAKDMAALERTFHFPHMRLASYPIQVLTAPGQQDDVFGRLASEGWDHSGWADRRVVQCSESKAHLTATFVRYKADGAEYARYDGLYVIELREGRWGITVRSTFAP
jgi:hypothetical protein